jgi:hypothetical protein
MIILPIFKKLSILPFLDLITTSNLKFCHSYVFSKLPIAFDNTWITVGQSREDNLNLELRNDAKYYIPRHRTDQIARLPLFNLPRIWSLHTPELSDSPTKFIFSTAVYTYL